MSRNVLIHTDGACAGNPGPGGWGAVLQFGKARKEISGSAEGTTTNNRMELQAVAEALACLTKPCTVVVKSDSSYVVTGLMINMHHWKANGWMKKGNQPLVHDDLWRRIYDLAETHTVIPMWVPGHAGDPLNDRADQLARQAIPVLA